MLKNLKRKKNNKGQVTIYITFIFASFVLLMLAAVFGPLGVRMNAEFYEVGEEIMLEANQTISKINNTEVRTSLLNNIQGSLDATEDNIEINSNIYKYGWVFVVLLGAIIMFLYQRRVVETGGSGFV